MFLGLDLGTSGLRGLLVSEDGAPVGDCSSAYIVRSPESGWSEQAPEDWLRACGEVLTNLRKIFPTEFSAIKGIGVSGHMHGATALNGEGEPLGPCILWNDGRAWREADELDADPAFRQISGNIVFPGFTAPKLLWMSRHQPEIFSRIDKVVLPKDYINFWLTGSMTTEMSDAAGTSWLDTEQRCWSDQLIENSALRRNQLPELVEGCQPIGSVRKQIAEEFGLPLNVTVVGGAADNAAAACGIGAVSDGLGFVSLGTSGVMLVAKDQFAPAPGTAVHTFCHAIPGKWYQMGVILSATDSLNWLATNHGRELSDLLSELPETSEGPSSVMFFPYLSGERTPHNDANIRGAFVGLSRVSNVSDLCQAVIEGVSFAMNDCYEAIKATGTELSSVMAIGGGSASVYWLQSLSNSLNLPLELPEKGDFGAAMGAARLAMTGVMGVLPEEVMTRPGIVSVIEPQPAKTAAYASAYQRYVKGYSALKEIQ
ncbi:MAG: xylulokinase [Pseudomonadota bacterium]